MDTINIHIEQAFYGHDGMMYSMLKTTSDSFNSDVEQLCQSIGTPDERPFDPFLISKPIGDKLFMACGREGEKDRSNRTTIFFHVIIVNRKDARIAGINAYRLYNEGYFVPKLPEIIESEDLCLSTDYDNSPSDSTQQNERRLVIRSNRPESPLIYKKFFDIINDVFWASYSFRIIPDADVYVLSDRAPLPNDRTCIDVFGNKLPTLPVDNSSNNQNSITIEENKPLAPKRTMKDFILKASLITNLVLILVAIVLYQFSSLRHPSNFPPKEEFNAGQVSGIPQTPPQDSQQSQEELKQTIRKEVIDELKKEFKGDHFKDLADWEKERNTSPADTLFSSKKTEKPIFVIKVDNYIKFVHSHILTEKENEEGKR